MSDHHTGSGTIDADVTVIIRSAGERTTDLTRQLLRRQVPERNICLIREYPFTQALRRSFELGLELDRPWTLCIDADMLPRGNSVQVLFDWTRTVAPNTFQVQGHVFDKMFGASQRGGPRLYRTALLREALECIPCEEEGTLRPERSTIRRMVARGYSSGRSDVIFAVHDFEQYYRDIYRKAFVHAHKHAPYMRHLEPFWHRMAPWDADYRVALWGLRAGRLSHGFVALDARHFPSDVTGLLDSNGLTEKGELAPQEIACWDVERVIALSYRTRMLAEGKLRREDTPG